ncbi:MAG: tetratricopeptide repeat protein [Steroidobacteraceae bacterium]
MTVFVAICVVLLAAAIGLLVWPLLRPIRDAGSAPRANVAATLVAAALPVTAFAIYFWASNWDWHAPEMPQAVSAPDLQRVAAELQQRLAKQPDDIEGWKLLGRSATVLGDYALARSAFGEAYTRTEGRDAEAVVGYAESRVLIDEREIDGEAAALFERALELAPDNARALWYGGIVAYRRGDMRLARQRWVELQQHDLPQDLRQVLAERLAELELSQGRPPSTDTASPASEAIEITVGVAPSLAERVPPDATLFVIARRGVGGPPLAVQRHPVGEWPLVVRLSDADAMLPGISLAGAGPLELVARISRSGQPIAASGDLFGEVGYDFASAHPASLTIDRIVP